MFDYALSLLDAPYVWWKPGDAVIDVDSPFWTREGPLPSALEVKEHGCNCAGLVNLLRRVGGLAPIGGTGEWWLQFVDARSPYDPTVTYPIGTLFLRPYTHPEDQGHLAVQTPWGVLHSVPEDGIILEATPDMSWCHAVVMSEQWLPESQ